MKRAPTRASKSRLAKASLSPVEEQVAQRLSRLRQENGLTLQEVSAATGLSTSYLSRVENGRTAVSVASLSLLADCFCVPVSVLFEGNGHSPKCFLVRAGEGKKVRLRGRRGIVVQMLASGMPQRLMEPFVGDVSTLRGEMPLQAHPGQEFIHLLEGSCWLDHAEQTHGLNQGDSVYFDATIPHRIRARNGLPCRFLAVVSAGDRRFHADIVQFLEDKVPYLP